MSDYEFYKGVFGGGSLEEEEFDRYLREARAELARLARDCTLTPETEDAERMALCQIAEVLAYFDWLQNGGLRGLSVGSVSQAGSGSAPFKQNKPGEIRRAVRLYYSIYRGPDGGAA